MLYIYIYRTPVGERLRVLQARHDIVLDVAAPGPNLGGFPELV